MALKQPITQVRLTNVAVVRYKKMGKRCVLLRGDVQHNSD